MTRGLFDLSGRLAVVTGASRGLGAAIAIALAEAGADIVGVVRSAGSDAGTAAAVRQLGRRYSSESTDFADRDAVAELAGRLRRLDQAVDILVNNAGTIERAAAEVHDNRRWDTVISVNLTTQFTLSREIGGDMLARGAGKIIFLASMQSQRAGRDIIGYAAAKSGIVGVVRSLANEWAARGVNVNAIAPGYIETDMTSLRHTDPAARAEVEARIPAGRWGQPRDLAGAAVFLAAAASDYVHGVVLPVDGGYLVR